MTYLMSGIAWVRRVIAYFLGQRWVRFGIVGVAATLTYAVLGLGFEHMGMPVLMGNFFAYLLAFGVSYMGQSRWTFQSTAQHRATLPKFALTQGIGLLFNSAIIAALIYSGLPYIFAMPVAIVTVPIVVFIICKYWVFRKGE